jgi:hypothetical protein
VSLALRGKPVKKFGHQQNALAPEKIPKIRKKTRSMSGYLAPLPYIISGNPQNYASFPEYPLDPSGSYADYSFYQLQLVFIARKSTKIVDYRSS